MENLINLGQATTPQSLFDDICEAIADVAVMEYEDDRMRTTIAKPLVQLFWILRNNK